MIYIVDDEEPIRDAVRWLLRSRGHEATAFDTGEAFLAFARARSDEPAGVGCIVLDVRMPGMSGTELFERLESEGLCGSWPVIFLTGHGDVPMAVDTLKHGAYDFVEKPFNDNSLVDRIEAAFAESSRRLATARAQRSFEERLGTLSAREREVMDLIVAGLYNKVIADRLGIAMRTVEVYRARLLEKMGVRSAVELAALLSARRPGT